MSEGDAGPGKSTAVAYKEALDTLSSLITARGRTTQNDGRFELLFQYVKILDLDESISQMKIIHVSGTKGKGSTCAFTESILRNCGFRTGLFTSPHLIDVRERFRLDGDDICEEKFLIYFWWCWYRLKEKCNGDIPMPSLFHFLALMAFKIFAEEQVDASILEVGLGGKFDATNLVQAPVVCGITSIGFDHMEILGKTLAAIAGEKAGILKQGVPAFTVSQPDDAMNVLEETALNLGVDLQVVPSLDASLLNGQNLSLDGVHQFLNAGLATALCSTWLQRTGHTQFNPVNQTDSLPKQFIKGLATARLLGRAQVVPDIEGPGDLVFYLDGAHSPESMEMCARWFCKAIKDNKHERDPLDCDLRDDISGSLDEKFDRSFKRNTSQVLLFNCLPMRDPDLLLPPLMKTCADQGVHFRKALFVPNMSVYNKIGSHELPPIDSQADVSWQLTLQKAWENLIHGDAAGNAESGDNGGRNNVNLESSSVFASLPLAVNWLRETVRRNHLVQFQVLVTGSLHLVGDALKLFRK